MPTPSVFPLFMKASAGGTTNVFGEVEIEVVAMPDVEVQQPVEVEVTPPVEVEVVEPVEVEVT
jgi:hypothetical protein